LISEERKLRVESKLKSNDINVNVLWETAMLRGSDYIVDVLCGIDKFISTRHVSSLAKGCFECQGCSSKKENEVANRNNFSIIDRNGTKYDGRLLTIKCNICGNVREITRSNLFNHKSIYCDGCRELSIKNKLEAKGAKFLYRELIDGNNHVFYIGTNGKTFCNRESNIVRDNFAINENHWDRNHYLYVFSSRCNDNSYIKIGTANNKKKRLKDLKLTFDCDILAQVPFDNRREATKVEQKLHKRFKDSNLNFDISTNFTGAYSKRRKEDGTRIKMGYTEWFDSSIQDELLEEIKLLTN